MAIGSSPESRLAPRRAQWAACQPVPDLREALAQLDLKRWQPGQEGHHQPVEPPPQHSEPTHHDHCSG
jgi:hypothetical protein